MNSQDILVVDDQEKVCRSVRKVLAKRGYSVDEALNADEALEKIDQKEYGLLLVDVMMPKINGLDLLSAAKQRRPNAVVIMITGYPSTENAVKAIQLGADDYIAKPFTANELTSLVEQAMRGTASGKIAPPLDQTEQTDQRVERDEDESTEIGRQAAGEVIDADMPFVTEEVEKYTSREYVDSMTRSDVTVPIYVQRDPGFCPLGQMICKKYAKTRKDCEEKCLILERQKKKAMQVTLFDKITGPIDVDMPFPMDEVELYTSAEYVMALGRSDMPVVAHWEEAARAVARQREELSKILVVDDEVTVCRSVRKILGKGGRREVDESSEPEDALKKLQTERYSAVILDLKLGAHDGLELLKKIKATRPEQKVVIITGYASVETAVKATKLGAEGFLPKPFTAAELRNAVDQVLAT